MLDNDFSNPEHDGIQWLIVVMIAVFDLRKLYIIVIRSITLYNIKICKLHFISFPTYGQCRLD